MMRGRRPPRLLVKALIVTFGTVAALLLVDQRATTLAAVGRLADRWPAGRPVTPPARRENGDSVDGVLQTGGDTFRVVTVPLQLEDVTIGSLYLATVLDRRYADQLDRLARARTAVLHDGVVIATTLSPAAAREFERALARGNAQQGIVPLEGGSHAYLQLAAAGPASFYALSSIDEASGAAMRRTNQSLAAIVVGAFALALLGSVWLAQVLTQPIGRLSASLSRNAPSHDGRVRLPLLG